MSDDFTKSFFEWVETQGVDVAEIAAEMGNGNVRSIRNWKFKGIPKRRRAQAEFIMKNWAKPGSDSEDHVVRLGVSEDRYRAYSFAALREGKILPDWMLEVCAQAAREKWLPKAAEEPSEYGAEVELAEGAAQDALEREAEMDSSDMGSSESR